MLLLIAVLGAGIAVGANAVFFSPASNERPAIEPRGLVDEIATGDVDADPSPEPSLSPSPTLVPLGEGTTTVERHIDGAAPVPPPPAADDDGPRDPRTPSGFDGEPQPSSFVVQGVVDDMDPPEDPCDLEESEREQQRCENEAERDENEAERDADEEDGR